MNLVLVTLVKWSIATEVAQYLKIPLNDVCSAVDSVWSEFTFEEVSLTGMLRVRNRTVEFLGF